MSSAPPSSSICVDNKSDPTTVHLILTGASGYLGQHLLAQWITQGVLPPSSSSSSLVQFQITALYHKSETFPSAVQEFREDHPQHSGILGVTVRSLDLTDQGETDSLVESTKGAAAVVLVHSAALSSPRACQANPEVAKAINVPKSFLDAFSSASAEKPPTSILALSTDQVYDGRQPSGSLYTEDEIKGLDPVNVYGRTKLELEQHLSKASSAVTVALRSSIILGPQAPIDPVCAHGTFLDFCQSRGHTGEATTFFTNEYRSVVRVDRVASTLSGLVARCLTTTTTTAPLSTSLPKVYNMGGPFRVNRMELAAAVFDKFGYDASLLLEAEQTSPMSPLDISMDSSRLFRDGILDESKEPKDSEAYLKDLVDFVFGV